MYKIICIVYNRYIYLYSLSIVSAYEAVAQATVETSMLHVTRCCTHVSTVRRPTALIMDRLYKLDALPAAVYDDGPFLEQQPS